MFNWNLKESYFFYSKNDLKKEPIFWVKGYSRLVAAKHFAQMKRLTLKQFLHIYSISK